MLLPGFDVILALGYLAAMLGNKRAKVDPDDDVVRSVPVSEVRQCVNACMNTVHVIS